jgi:hypothetical protein
METDEYGAVGTSLEEVVPGRYRILPESPLYSGHFEPLVFDAPTGTTTAVDIVVQPLPRLRIEGTVPASAAVTVAMPDDEALLFEAPEGASRTVPPSGPVAVRVEVRGRPAFFFPVGPLRDGVRTAVVEIPEPRRIITPPYARDVELWDGPREAYGFVDGDAYATDAVGPLTLRWTDPDGETWWVPVAVPETPGSVVTADATAKRRFVEEVVVSALEPKVDGFAKEYHAEDAMPGEMVVFQREGWRTLRATAPATGETALWWGTADLKLLIHDEEGDPVDAIVLADGEVYAAPEGVLELKGFDAGRVRVVAARYDEVGPGGVLEVELRDEQVSEYVVTFPSD